VRRRLPLSAPEAAALTVRARTGTPASRRTANRTAIARLRDQLPTQDRMLLILRIDRQLAWDDLARVFLEQADPAASDLKREAARLRKRFQLVKLRLLALARDAGLIESS
jgi:RNA polymerase sigma-70 factor (ECF subfamily)